MKGRGNIRRRDPREGERESRFGEGESLESLVIEFFWICTHLRGDRGERSEALSAWGVRGRWQELYHRGWQVLPKSKQDAKRKGRRDFLEPVWSSRSNCQIYCFFNLETSHSDPTTNTSLFPWRKRCNRSCPNRLRKNRSLRYPNHQSPFRTSSWLVCSNSCTHQVSPIPFFWSRQESWLFKFLRHSWQLVHPCPSLWEYWYEVLILQVNPLSWQKNPMSLLELQAVLCITSKTRQGSH